MKTFLKIICICFICISLCDSVFAATPQNAVLVNQPVYHSMNFYVYKPDNLPKEWCVTYDGYLVYKNAKGVWFYGSNEKNGLLKTGYVVGSVIPSVVRLKPYNKNISNIAPILNSNPEKQIETMNFSTSPKVYTPPSSMSSNFSSRFTAVSLWNATVDRIGVIEKPAIPVAWKGENPEVIYAWNGAIWKQILPLKNSKPINTLKNSAYNLKKETIKTKMKWTDEDTYALSNYAASWGYQWLGNISLNDEF